MESLGRSSRVSCNGGSRSQSWDTLPQNSFLGIQSSMKNDNNDQNNSGEGVDGLLFWSFPRSTQSSCLLICTSLHQLRVVCRLLLRTTLWPLATAPTVYTVAIAVTTAGHRKAGSAWYYFGAAVHRLSFNSVMTMAFLAFSNLAQATVFSPVTF